MVALASTDPIFFAPRCVCAAATLVSLDAPGTVARVIPPSSCVQAQAGQCSAGMEALCVPSRGPHHKAECLQELPEGVASIFPFSLLQPPANPGNSCLVPMTKINYSPGRALLFAMLSTDGTVHR